LSTLRRGLVGPLVLRAGLVLTVACLAPDAATAQAPHRGRVLTEQGVPIEGAVVRDVASGAEAPTDREGWFRWPGPRSGRWLVEVRAIGFVAATVTVSVGPDGLDPAELRLRSVQQLDSVTVRTRPRPNQFARFEERRKRGLGRFFVSDDLERTAAFRTSSLLRTLPAGVQIRDSAGIPQAVSMRGRRLDCSRGPCVSVPCVLRIAVDDHIAPWGTSLDDLDPTQIQAIEVYLGAAEIPLELAAARRDQLCGLIVFWTRRGR